MSLSPENQFCRILIVLDDCLGVFKKAAKGGRNRKRSSGKRWQERMALSTGIYGIFVIAASAA